MKERPIIFSAPMVMAILDGRKTQTRRIVKNAHMMTVDGEMVPIAALCPYGQPGARLWVREAWGALPHMLGGFQRESLRYRADGEYQNEHDAWRWRPSIHMPRWASRITLEITGVRVERLQDISEADAVAEGCKSIRPELMLDGLIVRLGRSAVEEFRLAWEEIHGGGSWEKNPWVWVIEFRKLEQQETA